MTTDDPKTLAELIERGKLYEVDMACRALRDLPRYRTGAEDRDLDHYWRHHQYLLEQLAFAERQYRNAARAVAARAEAGWSSFEIARACGLPPE